MFSFLPGIPGTDDLRASGPQSRHRPPPRRARRMRARARSAVRATRDERIRPDGDHRRRRPAAASCARPSRRFTAPPRTTADRRPDRPGADPRRRSRPVQELRDAIAAFSDVKPSLAWAETYPGTLSYYLASAFREVWMQPSGHRRTGRFRDQRAVPARRARQGGHRGAVRRPRRIQVGGKPFHAGPLHRSPPRGGQPADRQPARPGVAGGCRVPAHRAGRCRRTGRTRHRCCATTPSPDGWSTGSDSATRRTRGSANSLARRVFRRRPAMPTAIPTRRRGCTCRATPRRRRTGRRRRCRRSPAASPSRRSPSSPCTDRSSAAAAARRCCRSATPAQAATPSQPRCARPPPTIRCRRSCCASTAPAARSPARRPFGAR